MTGLIPLSTNDVLIPWSKGEAITRIKSEKRQGAMVRLEMLQRQSQATLTAANVAEIRELLDEGVLTGAEIGRRFNVTRTAIYHIKTGRTWKTAA